MPIKSTLFVLLTLILLSGCSQTVKINALQPAEVNRAAATKKLAVSPFDNDRIGLSSKVEAELSAQRVDGKPYFTLISRLDLAKIIDEQKYQNNGLLNPDDAVEVGNLMGAQAIISGHVSSPSIQDTGFYEPRTRCNKEKCWVVQIRCTKRLAGLSAQIRMVDVARGDIIYAETLEEHVQWKHCNDDSQAMPSRQIAADYLAGIIARRFAYKLTPHYISFEVELLEDPDIDYTDEQEDLLEHSLTYVEQQRYDKAEQLLRHLLETTDNRSYVPFYNLGVLYEAHGNYREAQNYYDAADNLTMEPVEAISAAVVRIRRAIAKDDEARAQLAAGAPQE